MNGFLLFIPLIVIRYGLLWLVNKKALDRAAFFPPRIGEEKIAFGFYQCTTLFLFIYSCFLRINTGSVWFYPGIIVYGLGTLLFIASVISYARPEANGMNLNGLYRISRNPMYVAYFIYLLGCVLLTRSLILFLLLAVFQISAHWVILSEERWCMKKFGGAYADYMKDVRRYL